MRVPNTQRNFKVKELCIQSDNTIMVDKETNSVSRKTKVKRRNRILIVIVVVVQIILREIVDHIYLQRVNQGKVRINLKIKIKNLIPKVRDRLLCI